MLALFVFAALFTMSGVHALAVVVVSPASGPQGTVVQIKGTGFTPNGEIKEYLWNGTATSTLTADANGNVSATATVPAVATGVYAINVTDVSSGASTVALFRVTQSSLPTTTTTPAPTVPEISPTVLVLAVLIFSSAAALLFLRKKAYSH